MTYILYETLPALAPLEEHEAMLADLEAHPEQDNPGIISALMFTRRAIERYKAKGAPAAPAA